MPKQIYIGMSKTTVNLTNMLTNGSLASATTGWTTNSYYTYTQQTENILLKVKTASTSTTTLRPTYQTISVEGSTAATKQILYAQAMTCGGTSNTSFPRFYLRSYKNGSTSTTMQYLSPSDSSLNDLVWHKISIYTSTYTDSGDYYSYDRFCFTLSPPLVVNETLYAKNIMLINLTEAFGAGNEPDKEWCDANISFFDGTTTIPKVNLINIIPDGDMEASSWTGGNYDTTNKYFSSRSQYFPANSSTIQTIATSTTLPIVGHKYYGRHYLKTNGNVTAADCRFEWYAGDGEGLNFVFGHNQGNYSDWTMESSIIQPTVVNGSSYICRSFVVNGTGDVWADGLMIIDLTKAFGAGNEPDKEWCDDNIPFFTNNDLIFSDTRQPGIAIKPVKIYIGINNTARKVKRGYIGINGVARKFIWPELKHSGTITALSAARDTLSGEKVGNYALFAGGINGSSNYFAVVDTYNEGLIKGTATSLSNSVEGMGSVSFGDYALFGGGSNGAVLYPIQTTIDVYDESLTKTNPISLSDRRHYLRGAKIGNYALMAGGYNGNWSPTYLATIDAYNSSLTQVTAPANLSSTKRRFAAAMTDSYVLFAGGQNSNVQSSVDAYNSSLVKTTCSALSSGRYNLSGINCGENYLFAGGFVSSYTVSSTIDVYTSSLVKTTSLNLSYARMNMISEAIDDYVIFAGGSGYESRQPAYHGRIDIFNKNLIACDQLQLSENKSSGAAVTIKDYILIAGGYNGSNSLSTVEVLELD